MYLGKCFSGCQLHLLLLSGEESVRVLNPQCCWVKKVKRLRKTQTHTTARCLQEGKAGSGRYKRYRWDEGDGRRLDFGW